MIDRELKTPEGALRYDWDRFLAGVHKGFELNHDYVEFVSSGAVARHVLKALEAYEDHGLLVEQLDQCQKKNQELQRERDQLEKDIDATADPFLATTSAPLLAIVALLRAIVAFGHGGATIACEDAELIVDHFDKLQFQRLKRFMQACPSTTPSEAPGA